MNANQMKAMAMAKSAAMQKASAVKKPGNRQSFRAGGFNTVVECRGCGKKTHSSIDGCLDLDLCRKCYDAANMENAHFDGHHADAAHPDCEHCIDAAAKSAPAPVVDAAPAPVVTPEVVVEVPAAPVTETLYPVDAPKAKPAPVVVPDTLNPSDIESAYATLKLLRDAIKQGPLTEQQLTDRRIAWKVIERAKAAGMNRRAGSTTSSTGTTPKAPRAPRAPKATLAVGAKVVVKPAKAADYEGMLPDGAMTVAALSTALAKLTDAEGRTYHLPVRDLVLA